MTKPRITGYKSKGMWNTYYGSLPAQVDAVIVHQNVTIGELRENFPELYKQAIAKIIKSECKGVIKP